MDHRFDHNWHVALNDYSTPMLGTGENVHWMYEAKHAAQESARLPLLFAMERKGELPTIHKQCSMSAPEEVADNRLTCCLGKECRNCEHLLALDSADLPGELIDQAKAWTCVSHILHECGKGMIDTSEGYILTVSDQMYWENVYSSLASANDAE
jgi:hypothetical protein